MKILLRVLLVTLMPSLVCAQPRAGVVAAPLSTEERLAKVERDLAEATQRFVTLAGEMREAVVHTREALTQLTMRLQRLEQGGTISGDEDVVEELRATNKQIRALLKKMAERLDAKEPLPRVP